MQARTVLNYLRPPIWELGKEMRALQKRNIDNRHLLAVRRASLTRLPSSVDLTAGLIVDIGANVGDWTDAAAALPGTQVLCVEANPDLLPGLRARFAHSSNVRIDGRAIAERSGQATFHAFADSHFGSLLVPERELEQLYVGLAEETGQMKVETTTLDDLAGASSVSLLKVDVQGAELGVFAGGTDTLAKTQAVLVEANFSPQYKGGALFRDVDVALTEHGFVLWDFTNQDRLASGQLMWADAIYVAERLARAAG